MTNRTREHIISQMCFTYRHDFGLTKTAEDFAFSAGMTDEERKALWNQMAQIFDNDIAPNMEFKKE